MEVSRRKRWERMVCSELSGVCLHPRPSIRWDDGWQLVDGCPPAGQDPSDVIYIHLAKWMQSFASYLEGFWGEERVSSGLICSLVEGHKAIGNF